MGLSDRAISTFAAVADTLLPATAGEGAAWSKSATELGLPARLRHIYDLLPSDRARREARQLLALLDSAAGGLMLYRKPRKFRSLSPLQRADALRSMSTSPLGPARQAFKALKLLVGYLYTTPPEGSSVSPVWEAMGYPGPDGPPPDVPKPITPTHVTSDEQWTADVVIVGSGAGGGVAAGVLAAAGLDVVVLEKGGYHNEADFTHIESEAYRDMYLDKGLHGTVDSGFSILAGSTLGGGTVINYTTSFATPEQVRSQWDTEARFREVFTGEDFERSSLAVHERLGVNTDNNSPSRREELMDKGLRELGWHVESMPRNVAGCSPADCGYCTMGCRTGSKQSTLATYLEDAHRAGARIVVGADVDKVTTENGTATGVTAGVNGHRLEVRARAVVLAAGALNTPAILLRSKLGGAAVGRNLRLHPVTAVWGRFAEPVEPWTGIMQAVYSDQFTDLDGQGFGFKFETAPVHPLFPVLFIGWEDGASFKRDLLGLNYMSPIGIVLRDRGSGRVKIGRDGRPTWHYRLSKVDTDHMREGVRRASEALLAAGAVEVLSSTSRPVRWSPALGGSLDGFLSDIASVGYANNRMTYLSFHQMGSARMGSRPENSVVDQENQVHGTPGLYVMDASTFPLASGVNPMISIETIAHRGASALAARL